MPTHAKKVENRTSSDHRSGRPRPERDFLPGGGPPREVIIRIEKEHTCDDDDLLDELLDDHSTVSSLGGGGPAAHKNSNNKHHDLDKVLGEIDVDDEMFNNKSKGYSPGSYNQRSHPSSGTYDSKVNLDSPGLAAARERYKNQSYTSGEKSPLIHRFGSEEEQDPTRGNMEEVSLGLPPKEEKIEKIEVIDVEKVMKSRRQSAGQQKCYPSKVTQQCDNTSETASNTCESPIKIKVTPQQAQVPTQAQVPKPKQQQKEQSFSTEDDEDDDDEDNDSGDEQDEQDEGTAGTKDLLARAKDRLTIQKLHEQIDQLKEVISKKNEELEILAGQLRRAVETKCDLVLAHTELERHHEFDLKAKEMETAQLQKANFGLVEGLANVEKDLLNEIVRLNVELTDTRKQHVQEMQDWERMHKNEMLEKDCEVARLKEEIRKLLLRNSSKQQVIHQIVECN